MKHLLLLSGLTLALLVMPGCVHHNRYHDPDYDYGYQNGHRPPPPPRHQDNQRHHDVRRPPSDRQGPPPHHDGRQHPRSYDQHGRYY